MRCSATLTDPEAVATWGNTTEPHNPIANLFNGSVTMARGDLERAFDPLIEAFLSGGGGTVVTLRFMKRAAGLLAPARFADNVVIDFDGPRSDVSHESYRAVVTGWMRWAFASPAIGARPTIWMLHGWRATMATIIDRFRAAQRRMLPDPGDLAVFGSDSLTHLGLI